MSYVPSRVASNESVHGNYYVMSIKPLRRLRKEPLPPQFSMVWVPGVDLIPLSYAYYEKGIAYFFYKVVGEGTKALSLRRAGDIIAISEPIGRSFLPRGGTVLLAGGSGIAPLLHYTKFLEEPRGMWGVKQGELAARLIEVFPRLKFLHIASEDCTYGLCGKLTDFLYKVKIEENEVVLVSGPREMVRRVCEELAGRRGVPTYVVAETMVKCGLGICGSCVIGGVLLCKDGPTVGCELFAQHVKD